MCDSEIWNLSFYLYRNFNRYVYIVCNSFEHHRIYRMFFRLTSTLLPFALSLWLLEGNIFRSHIETRTTTVLDGHGVGFWLNTNESSTSHLRMKTGFSGGQTVYHWSHLLVCNPCGQSEQKEKAKKKAQAQQSFCLVLINNEQRKNYIHMSRYDFHVRPCRTDFTPCGLQERALPPTSLAFFRTEGNVTND